MKDLLILGTGVHGGEIVEIIERINSLKPQWNIVGFVTQHSFREGSSFNGYPVVGRPEDIERYPQASLIAEYEWPHKLDIPVQRLVSIVDPSSFVSRTAEIGPGSIVYPNCYIGLNVRIGKFVFCLSGSIINHDDIIEDLVTIASGVKLAGNVHVEEECYLGQGCTVRQELKIGRKSFIGTGAVVVKDVEHNSVMIGNPARRLRDNE